MPNLDDIQLHSGQGLALLQSCVLGFALLPYRQIRVGIFPNRQEVSVSSDGLRTVAINP